MTTDALALRATVHQLVTAFQEAEAVVRASFGAILSAEAKLNAAFAMGDKHAYIRIYASGCHHPSQFDEVERTIAEMGRAAWQTIVARLELRRLLSVARYNQLQEELEKGKKLPPITEDNVNAFVKRFIDQMVELHDEAVREVFERLRPPGSKYKTNSELEIPAKVILRYVAEPGFMGGWRVCSWRAGQELVAMENVFSALDGRGMVNKASQSAIQTAIEQSKDGTGETEYFAFKAYGNKNFHLRFKRLDLLKALNMKAGGMRLRPAADAA